MAELTPRSLINTLVKRGKTLLKGKEAFVTTYGWRAQKKLGNDALLAAADDRTALVGVRGPWTIVRTAGDGMIYDIAYLPKDETTVYEVGPVAAAREYDNSYGGKYKQWTAIMDPMNIVMPGFVDTRLRVWFETGGFAVERAPRSYWESLEPFAVFFDMALKLVDDVPGKASWRNFSGYSGVAVMPDAIRLAANGRKNFLQACIRLSMLARVSAQLGRTVEGYAPRISVCKQPSNWLLSSEAVAAAIRNGTSPVIMLGGEDMSLFAAGDGVVPPAGHTDLIRVLTSEK